MAGPMARQRRQRVFSFARPGDSAGQDFARGLGAVMSRITLDCPFR
jgi:hypothetical protein